MARRWSRSRILNETGQCIVCCHVTPIFEVKEKNYALDDLGMGMDQNVCLTNHNWMDQTTLRDKANKNWVPIGMVVPPASSCDQMRVTNFSILFCDQLMDPSSKEITRPLFEI